MSAGEMVVTHYGPDNSILSAMSGRPWRLFKADGNTCRESDQGKPVGPNGYDPVLTFATVESAVRAADRINRRAARKAA